MLLVRLVLDPEVPHVHGFRAARFDGAVGNTSSGGVVSLDRGRALGVSQFFKRGTEWESVASIVEQGT